MGDIESEDNGSSDKGVLVTNEQNSWAVGWLAFAVMMMVLGGTWWIIAGIVALANSTFYVVGQE